MISAPLAPIPDDPQDALAPYDPAAGHGPWDARLAGHLLRRALGGGPPDRVERLAADGPAGAVAAVCAPPDPETERALADIGRNLAAGGSRAALAAWWLMKLANETRAPGNRLTLFWHDHFACAQSKVDDLGALFEQHELLRARGEGPFETLLIEMARDPAMLRFLDGDTNRRGAPNENLAREILELFSLGVGHYSEADVQEAARALTGSTVRNGRYAFVEEHHDPRPKRVLGTEIRDGDDLCRLAAAQPACPRFLADKFWRFYVSPEPPGEVLALLAERWREQDLRTEWLVQTLLASRAFYSREAYRSLVKSPVDYVIGAVRSLDSRPEFVELAGACDRMGQRLFEPPGVQGWEGGEAWIHSAAWIERTNFAADVGAGRAGMARGVDLDALAPPAIRGEAAPLLDRLLAVFLQADLPDGRCRSVESALDDGASPRQADALLPAALQAVLCLPEYHLA